jgi:hypothetical protein
MKAGVKMEKEIEQYFKNLSEEKGRSRQRGIYKLYCMVGYSVEGGDSKRGLDDILADIRALEHVTIVTVVISNEAIAEKRYAAGLSIKFIPSIIGEFQPPESIKLNILRSMKKIKNLERIFKVSPTLERVE